MSYVLPLFLALGPANLCPLRGRCFNVHAGLCTCHFECPQGTDISLQSTPVNPAQGSACGMLSPPPTRPGPRRYKDMLLDALRVEDNKLEASIASTSKGPGVGAVVSKLGMCCVFSESLLV